jgi:hypothetical protein
MGRERERGRQKDLGAAPLSPSASASRGLMNGQVISMRPGYALCTTRIGKVYGVD